MTTTLPLIETFKIDTRRDGAISYAKVRVVLDGTELVTDFRARVGDEPVLIGEGTITVSDAQIAAKRQGIATRAVVDAADAARVDSAVAEARAKIERFITAKNAGPAAAAELRAHVEADLVGATAAIGSPAQQRFAAGVRAIAARHAL